MQIELHNLYLAHTDTMRPRVFAINNYHSICYGQVNRKRQTCSVKSCSKYHFMKCRSASSSYSLTCFICFSGALNEAQVYYYLTCIVSHIQPCTFLSMSNVMCCSLDRDTCTEKSRFDQNLMYLDIGMASECVAQLYSD